MTHIQLPVSKSIANRLLILQAINGLPLFDVTEPNMPEDVRLMHDALLAIKRGEDQLMLDNCGTAMRFLTAFCAQLSGRTVSLDGNPRMRQRPIAQLVDALQAIGADIEYLGQNGFPPLKIRGKTLRQTVDVSAITLDSSQFVSALLLIGLQVYTADNSPYIRMTRKIIAQFPAVVLERDWSAAAFWYEYIALHGGELFLDELRFSDLQGDKIVAELFRHFGVATYELPTGIRIVRENPPDDTPLQVSFRDCPDLYPAVAITCRQMNVPLIATDTDRLRYKESDRLEAVQHLAAENDHRMAMALLAADLPCDDKACIAKSYPTFYQQLCRLP